MSSSAGQKATTDSSIFVYSVRRLIVPCLLSNAASGLDDPRIFRRMLYIITCLWSDYRKSLKVEIAVLMDYFLIRVIGMGPQIFSGRKSRFDQQIDVLTEVVRWFESPNDILELFMNYDADEKSDWKTCKQMCSAVCTLAEQCGEVMFERSSHANLDSANVGAIGVRRHLSRTRGAARTIHDQAINVICHLVSSSLKRDNITMFLPFVRELIALIFLRVYSLQARCLKNVCWHIYIHQGENNNTETNEYSRAPWAKDKSFPSILSTPPRLTNEKPKVDNQGKVENKALIPRAAVPSSAKAENEKKQGNPLISRALVVYRDPHGQLPDDSAAAKALDIAFQIVVERGLKRALDYLIACNVLTPSARDVASFLRLHRERIDPAILGKFLGEGHRSEEDYWHLIRYHYVRATSFVDMGVEQGCV